MAWSTELSVIVKCVEFTNAAVCTTPLKVTMDVDTKFSPTNVNVCAPVPATTVDGDKLVRLGCGLLPTPARFTDCGLPVALSVNKSAALSGPLLVGLKVTPTTQVPVGTTVAPEQASALFAKSLGFAPLTITVVMLKLAVPLLVTVKFCAPLVFPTVWFPKFRLAAEGVKAEVMPIPLSITICTPPAALSVMFTEAARFPAAEGVNVKLAVQLALGAIEFPHVFVIEKSVALGPVLWMLAILKVAAPVLVTETL